MSTSLRPHGLQHVRLFSPPLSPGVCSDSCLSSQWCYLTISFSSTTLFFAFNLAQHQGLFQLVGSLHQVTKYSNEYSGLISFRIGWFDLLAVQRTLKSLLQHYNSKASILWCSVFFVVQLAHLYMTTRKTIALTIQAFVCLVMSLLFKTLLKFVIAFLPRSKHLLKCQ